MRPVSSLRFNRRIPPRVIMNHCIGGRKIETCSACFRAYEENGHLGGLLKSIDDRCSIFRVSIEVTIRSSLLVKSSRDQLQHSDELRKDQYTVPAIDCLFQ